MLLRVLLIVSLLGGGQIEWKEFATADDAEAYRVWLFGYNRKYHNFLRKRGYDLPLDWERFKTKVTIK